MLTKIKHLLNFKKKKKITQESPEITLPKGWQQPLSAQELLDTPLRQQYLNKIWQNVSMTPDSFDELYKKPIEKYAELVQLLPASESHHHSHLGGMLDHGLEVIAIASKLRQNYVLPQNAAPEEQAKQRDAWTAIIIYAALLHDIGKIAVDVTVMLNNEKKWFPWQGKPTQPYRFFYNANRDYNLHPAFGTFLITSLIPPVALDWLATYPTAFASLIYYASGHTDRAGILSEIIQKSDQLSVTMALGGDINKLDRSPKISFAKQLQIALVQVVKGYKLNASKGGCDGFLDESGLWVMSKKIADDIRACLAAQGISCPSRNGQLFDELQVHNLVATNSKKIAVWNCKINSDAGWTPSKPFTLIKISPQMIWNSAEMPELFKGTITPLEEEIPYVATTETEENQNTDKAQEQNQEQKNIQEIPEGDNGQKTETEENIDNTETDSEDTLTNSMLDMFDSTDDDVSASTEGEEENKTETVEEDQTEPVILQSEQVDIATKEKKIEIPKIENKIKKRSTVNQSTKKQKPTIPKVDLALSNTKSENKVSIDDFIEWIKKGVAMNRLSINNTKALLHIVNDHLFLVTPSVFKKYCIEKTGNTSPKSKEWEKLQKDFQNLGLHKKRYIKEDKDSVNFWDCKTVGGKRESRLTGYLIENKEYFLKNKRMYNNHHLELIQDK